jgi:hypothetical protein
VGAARSREGGSCRGCSAHRAPGPNSPQV